MIVTYTYGVILLNLSNTVVAEYFALLYALIPLSSSVYCLVAILKWLLVSVSQVK